MFDALTTLLGVMFAPVAVPLLALLVWWVCRDADGVVRM